MNLKTLARNAHKSVGFYDSLSSLCPFSLCMCVSVCVCVCVRARACVRVRARIYTDRRKADYRNKFIDYLKCIFVSWLHLLQLFLTRVCVSIVFPTVPLPFLADIIWQEIFLFYTLELFASMFLSHSQVHLLFSTMFCMFLCFCQITQLLYSLIIVLSLLVSSLVPTHAFHADSRRLVRKPVLNIRTEQPDHQNDCI
jgi:hypothetical protein